MIPIVTGVHGVMPKGLIKGLEDLEIITFCPESTDLLIRRIYTSQDSWHLQKDTLLLTMLSFNAVKLRAFLLK